jgi:D-arabinose 1-dehydrogenase-like Zn-dependent alcohol dehydrogenase
MKAAVLHEIGKPLVVEEVPCPTLEPGEVLVQVHTCGICRTDLHIQDGLAYVPSLPHIPGHEPAGVVAEVAGDVREIFVGQRVVPHLFVNSAECRYTREGLHAQATHLRGIIGVTLPGGFAEYLKVPARNLLPLPDAVSFDRGGLASCAAITAVHAFRKSGLNAGDTAIVMGCGGIGLILVQLLRAANVRVMAIDRAPAALELASQAGAELAAPADATCAEVVRALVPTDRDGVDVVFELVGRAASMKAAAELVRRGGQIIVIGEEAEYPAIDTIHIAQREIRIVGSRNGGLQDARDALDWMARGTIRPHVAATYPLAKINEAFEMARDGRAGGRVIVQIKS